MSRRADDAVARTLPHNLDAERAVLGAILIDNAGYDTIAGWLDAKQFFRDAHRKIFAALGTVIGKGQDADLVALKEELTRVGLLEDVGGQAYIASLVDGVPRSTNVKYYAGIVREKAALRRLVKIGSTLVDRAYEASEGPQALIAQADTAMTALASDAKWQNGAVPLSEGLGALSAELAKRIEHSGHLRGVSSGLPTLDLFTGGWQRRKMIVIAADTSVGKSVLALDQARAFAAAGERVVYYTYEMPSADMHWRLLSSISGVALSQMGWGNVRTPNEFAAIAEAQEVMADLPIEFNDSSARSVFDIRAECRQIKADRGLGAVFIDHFQLMNGVEGENRTQQLADISRRLQELTHELDVPLFVLSQLTLDKNFTGEPGLLDLRECKSLGHDCDIALFLHPNKPELYRSGDRCACAEHDTGDCQHIKLLLRKQRGGPTGKAQLHLQKDFARFVEGQKPAPATKEDKPKSARRTAPKW